jgi:hypothetical protein
MEDLESPPMDTTACRSWLWGMAGAIQVILVGAIGIALTLRWRPAPHSDWLYYWRAAGNVEAYERGGLSLWLLSIPKALGLSPDVASLLLNLPAVVVLAWLAYRVDRSRWKVCAQVLMAYLLLISPFLGIVQLDLVPAAQLAIGLWLVMDTGIALPRQFRFLLALLAIVFAVSSKPQYALIIWAMTGMVLLGRLLFGRRRFEGLSIVLGVLLAGSLLGFATDMGLRHLSGRTQQIRTSSAVTLYGGLLVSSEKRTEGCGYWSVKAAEAAKQDLEKPLEEAVVDRLQARPVGHWLSVVRCKMPEIVRPVPYALYWLIESPNVREAIDASPQHDGIEAIYQKARRWEERLYRWVTAFVLLLCAWTTLRLWRRLPGMAILPVLWVLSFWAVHSVFEIQGRYFLGMFVIAPLLCALLYRKSATARPPLFLEGISVPASG